MPLSEKIKRAKYPLIAIAAAGSLATAFLAGANCHSDEKPAEQHSISAYEEALDKFAECESYLLDESFEKANECSKSLASIALESNEERQSISRLSERFDEKLQDSVESKYNLMLKNAEAELNLGHYDYALQLSNRIEDEIEKMDFFNEQEYYISKANQLERKINDEKGKQGGGFSYIEEYYNKIKQLYLALGFGQPLSDIAAALTILLPVYGVARKLRKKIS